MMRDIKHLIGKMLKLPLTDREIPVIADAYVDKEFGTGCVKITPAHDPNDFEVGKRHNLPEINIMNDDATINELGGKYAGMDRYEARKAMVKDLEDLGLLVKVVPHHAQRRHTRPLQDDGRADDQAAVVCQNGRDGKTGDRGTEKRRPASSYRNVSERHTCTGWKTSVTGVFPDSCGGDTGFRRITVTTAARL